MVRILACGSLLIALAGLSGCGLGSGSPNAIKTTTPAVIANGLVHGGQNPVTGATIQVWQAGTTGFGLGASSLMGSGVTVTTSDGTGSMDSNANLGNAYNTLPAGEFTLNFTGSYSCPTSGSQLVYMTATGGNPGLSGTVNNTALVLLAPLGQCGTITSTTFITINEVTTVGAVEALAPFLSASGIGSPSDSASLQAISNAFGGVNTMVNITTGTALSGFPKVSTLANALVPCVNSVGPPTSSDCMTLFSDTTPSGGTLPSTVLGAILNVALNPTLNGTPIYDLSLPNAPFQPALTTAPILWNITTSGAAKSACGTGGGGDDVSGTISYSGSATGRIYIALNNTSGCDVGTQGTSIASAGTYTIHGVPPGTYTLQAFMDTRGYGQNNAADPTASSASFGVGAANVTAPTVTLGDPGTVTITTAPTLSSVGPYSGGAVVQFKPVKSNGAESATSYTLQWSTNSFSTTAGSKIFPAVGGDLNIWFVNGLTNTMAYTFRAYATSAGTAQGPYSTVAGPVTIGALTAGSAVSGSIGFSGTATGPMYVGFYNQDNNTTPAYLEPFASPMNPQTYTVDVPDSSSAVYIPVAFIDQNNDGVADFGDLTNVNFQGGPIAVTGTTANQNLTLPSGHVLANVPTQHFYDAGVSQNYGLYFNLTWASKLPVAVTLLNSYNPDGANIDSGPMDLANCAVPNVSCSEGSGGFEIFLNLGTTVPSVGDDYLFNITYNDGTSETVAATLSNVLSVPATNLAPTSGTSTSPTFTWTDPVCGACSGYTYQFYISGPSGGIWSVPGSGDGLAPGTASLTWPTDPTDSSNTPSVTTLTGGTSYSWSVTVQDSNYNQAIDTVTYEP